MAHVGKLRYCKSCGRRGKLGKLFPAGGGSYCSPECKKRKGNTQHAQRRKQIAAARKPSAVSVRTAGQVRGYDPAYYATPDWKKRRDAQLERRPDCWLCFYPAETAHHTSYKNFASEREADDLISLCHQCHQFVTALHRSKMIPVEQAHQAAAGFQERWAAGRFWKKEGLDLHKGFAALRLKREGRLQEAESLLAEATAAMHQKRRRVA